MAGPESSDRFAVLPVQVFAAVAQLVNETASNVTF